MDNSLWKNIIKTEIKVSTRYYRQSNIFPQKMILIISNINLNSKFNAKNILENKWIIQNLCNLILIGDGKNANMKLPLAFLANRINLP